MQFSDIGKQPTGGRTLKGINTVTVGGNLTREPELRMAGATQVLQFGIAVNDSKKNADTGQWEDVPNYFNVTVFGSYADALSRYLQKGMKVVVKGRLRYHSWKDKDGANRSTIDIIAEDVMTMTVSQKEYGNSEYAAPTNTAQSAEILAEDIPF